MKNCRIRKYLSTGKNLINMFFFALNQLKSFCFCHKEISEIILLERIAQDGIYWDKKRTSE